jgi:hypothetical protein
MFVMLLLAGNELAGEPVRVRYKEGLVHGYLGLSTQDGKRLASGDLIQTARGDRVTTRVVFHFTDGSVYDETSVYAQARYLRLLRNHLVQKGPAFPQPIDLSIDAMSGQVIVKYTEDDRQQKTVSEKIDIPADLSNGLLLTLLKNIQPGAPPKELSLIVATPKPRLVKLAILDGGKEPFSTAGADRTAIHYIVKVKIGGIAGVFAPLLGKQPPDSHVWILGGEAPAFAKSEQLFFLGGPLWRIELVSPVWPRGKVPR